MNIEELYDSDPKFHSDWKGGLTSYPLGKHVLLFLQEWLTSDSATLETGAGMSTVLFALTGCRHTSISPDEGEFDRIRTFCSRHGISVDHVRFHHGRSEFVLPTLALPELDVVLVDGRHAFPSPFIDWFYGAHALKVGGLIVVDDTHIHTGHVLMEFMAEDPHWEAVRSFPTAAIFEKRGEHALDPEWDKQPYVASRTEQPHPPARGLAAILGRLGLRR